jgi:hypothetical protein
MPRVGHARNGKRTEETTLFFKTSFSRAQLVAEIERTTSQQAFTRTNFDARRSTQRIPRYMKPVSVVSCLSSFTIQLSREVSLSVSFTKTVSKKPPSPSSPSRTPTKATLERTSANQRESKLDQRERDVEDIKLSGLFFPPSKHMLVLAAAVFAAAIDRSVDARTLKTIRDTPGRPHLRSLQKHDKMTEHKHNINSGYDQPFGAGSVCWNLPLPEDGEEDATTNAAEWLALTSFTPPEQHGAGASDQRDALQQLLEDQAPHDSLTSAAEPPDRMPRCLKGWEITISPPELVEEHHENKVKGPLDTANPVEGSLLKLNEVYRFGVSVSLELPFSYEKSLLLGQHNNNEFWRNETLKRASGILNQTAFVRLILCNVEELGYCTPYSPDQWAKSKVNKRAADEVAGHDADATVVYERAALDFHDMHDTANMDTDPVPVYASPYFYLSKPDITCFLLNTSTTSSNSNNSNINSNGAKCQATYNTSIAIRVDEAAINDTTQPTKTFFVLGHVSTLLDPTSWPANTKKNNNDTITTADNAEGTIKTPWTELRKLDMANTLHTAEVSHVVTYQPQADIASNSIAYKTVAGIVIGLVVLYQCWLLLTLTINLQHKAIQLSQGPVLVALLVCCMIATAASYLVLPLSDNVCLVREFMILMPLTVCQNIMLARMWRICALLRPIMQIGRGNKGRGGGGASDSRWASTLPESSSHLSDVDEEEDCDDSSDDDEDGYGSDGGRSGLASSQTLKRRTINNTRDNGGSKTGSSVLNNDSQREMNAQKRSAATNRTGASTTWKIRQQKWAKDDVILEYMAECVTDHLLKVLSFLADYESLFRWCRACCTSNFSDSMASGFSLTSRSRNNNGIRKNIPLSQLFWLVVLLSLPQLFLQICGMAIPCLRSQRVEELNESMTVGRYECSRSASSVAVSWIGVALFLVPSFLVVILSVATRDYPTLFNEARLMKKGGKQTLLAIIVAVPLLILTSKDNSIPPDVMAFIWMVFVMFLACLPVAMVLLPKLKIVWRGETVVLSSYLQHTNANTSHKYNHKSQSSILSHSHQSPVPFSAQGTGGSTSRKRVAFPPSGEGGRPPPPPPHEPLPKTSSEKVEVDGHNHDSPPASNPKLIHDLEDPGPRKSSLSDDYMVQRTRSSDIESPPADEGSEAEDAAEGGSEPPPLGLDSEEDDDAMVPNGMLRFCSLDTSLPKLQSTRLPRRITETSNENSFGFSTDSLMASDRSLNASQSAAAAGGDVSLSMRQSSDGKSTSNSHSATATSADSGSALPSIAQGLEDESVSDDGSGGESERSFDVDMIIPPPPRPQAMSESMASALRRGRFTQSGRTASETTTEITEPSFNWNASADSCNATRALSLNVNVLPSSTSINTPGPGRGSTEPAFLQPVFTNRLSSGGVAPGVIGSAHGMSLGDYQGNLSVHHFLHGAGAAAGDNHSNNNGASRRLSLISSQSARSSSHIRRMSLTDFPDVFVNRMTSSPPHEHPYGLAPVPSERTGVSSDAHGRLDLDSGVNTPLSMAMAMTAPPPPQPLTRHQTKSAIVISKDKPLPSRLLRDMLRLKPLLEGVLHTSMTGIQPPSGELESLRRAGRKLGRACDRMEFAEDETTVDDTGSETKHYYEYDNNSHTPRDITRSRPSRGVGDSDHAHNNEVPPPTLGKLLRGKTLGWLTGSVESTNLRRSNHSHRSSSKRLAAAKNNTNNNDEPKLWSSRKSFALSTQKRKNKGGGEVLVAQSPSRSFPHLKRPSDCNSKGSIAIDGEESSTSPKAWKRRSTTF